MRFRYDFVYYSYAIRIWFRSWFVYDSYLIRIWFVYDFVHDFVYDFVYEAILTTGSLSHSFEGLRRAQESAGEHRRVQESAGEPRRAQESTGERRGAQSSAEEPRRAQESAGEPRRAQESAGEPRRSQETLKWRFWNPQKARPSHEFDDFVIWKYAKIILSHEAFSKFRRCNMRIEATIFIPWHCDCGCKTELPREPLWRRIRQIHWTVPRENLRNTWKFTVSSPTVTGIQKLMSPKPRALVDFRRFWRQFYVFAKHDFA